MNPADVRAQIAVELRRQDLQMWEWLKQPYQFHTWDEYLAAAQTIMESSWKNYKHPAGMDESKLGEIEAIELLISRGYKVSTP